MDDAVSELLEGLDEPERRARQQLLDLLTELGFTPAEMIAAAAENRLTLLPVERVLGGRYTAAEVEERSGTPAALIGRIRRLSGLPHGDPGDRVFGEPDIEMARSVRLFLEAGISVESLEEVTRVMGEAMSRVAMTVTAGFASSFLAPGDSEDAVAVRFATLAEALTPAMTPVLNASFSAHLRESVGRGMIGRAELQSGHIVDAPELAVAFADLVGFTRLGGELEAEDLGSVATRLAAIATDLASPPVRLVKTIGDAALFVSPDAEALVHVALDLLAEASEAGLPSLRVGIALGPTLQRSGDVFGHTVNLASRVTGAARPDSVLCTEEVRERVDDGISWSAAGHFRLKGVQRPVAVYRARSADESEQTDGEKPAARSERSRRKPRADRPRR